MKIAVLAIPALVLTACAGELAPPVVSGFNGDSVSVQDAGMFPREPRAEVIAEAQRVCGRAGNAAEYASTRQVSDFVQEHLFLCI